MKTGIVLGNIWATRKEKKLEGLKLLIVQPTNLLDDSNIDEPIIAADMIDAGVGEEVIYVAGSSARGAVGDMTVPVDATVVAIVDGKDVDKSLI